MNLDIPSYIKRLAANPLTRIIISAVLMGAALILEHFSNLFEQREFLKIICHAAAFAFVGIPVILEAVECALSHDYFTEFTLMSIASIGAFAIGEYPEGVAVMLLYALGEYFQDKAVDSARGSIKALVNIRPLAARVKNGDAFKTVDPMQVAVGDVIVVNKGERVCADGVVLTSGARFDTSSLTGESEPRYISKGEEVLSGMIILGDSAEIKIIRVAAESELERILKLVEEAGEKKSHTELFIRKFARVYTPVMIGLAVLTVLLPWIYSLASSYLNGSCYEYNFGFWLYKALMLLVISCPCALVISVPLSYYSGIGVASKHGILFKGGTYIDALCKVKVVLFDKTGTLTVPQNIVPGGAPANDGSGEVMEFSEVLKSDAAEAVKALKSLGIEEVAILSGDRREKVKKVAEAVGADNCYAELLPHQKLELMNKYVQSGKCCAFAGDGVNDAPVLRSASVGIAMGALGSEAAVESADVVLKTDQPSKIAAAIRIARKTVGITKENITGVLIVKVLILALGFAGVASLWGAVFADSGLALLAVANSLRVKNTHI